MSYFRPRETGEDTLRKKTKTEVLEEDGVVIIGSRRLPEEEIREKTETEYIMRMFNAQMRVARSREEMSRVAEELTLKLKKEDIGEKKKLKEKEKEQGKFRCTCGARVARMSNLVRH